MKKNNNLFQDKLHKKIHEKHFVHRLNAVKKTLKKKADIKI